MLKLILAATLLLAAIACGTASAKTGPDVRVFAHSCGWIGSGDEVRLYVEITAENLTGEDFIDAKGEVYMLDRDGNPVMVVQAPYIGQWFGTTGDGKYTDTYFKRDLNIERSAALQMYQCKAEFTELGEPLETVQLRTSMWGDHPEY